MYLRQEKPHIPFSKLYNAPPNEIEITKFKNHIRILWIINMKRSKFGNTGIVIETGIPTEEDCEHKKILYNYVCIK